MGTPSALGRVDHELSEELFHGGRPAWFLKTPFLEDFKSPVGDWLEHKQSMAHQAGTNLRHIRERELSRRNRLRRPASFKIGDLVLVHHSRLPSRPRDCLKNLYFGPYRIIRIDGSRIHVRCSPRLGGVLLCAPKQLRHYHSPDDLSWDELRLNDSEVVRMDLENAASPEEADELEEMTPDEMAVDGYYEVARIVRHEYKQRWKFLTLWDRYELSEAAWEPMSAFIQPDGSINPIFRSYLVENNEGQLLTRAETLSQRKKKKSSPPGKARHIRPPRLRRNAHRCVYFVRRQGTSAPGPCLWVFLFFFLCMAVPCPRLHKSAQLQGSSKDSPLSVFLVPISLLFSNLQGAVSTLVLMARPTQCVLRRVQDSCRAAVTVNVLTPTVNPVPRSRHLHIRWLRSSAPAQAVPCSPMPMVTSVSQMTAYHVCSHPASVGLVDHVLHGICPDGMTLGSQQRAVA